MPNPIEHDSWTWNKYRDRYEHEGYSDIWMRPGEANWSLMLKNRLTKTYPARLDPAEILDLADDDTIWLDITPNPGEDLGSEELLPGQWDFKLEGSKYTHRAHLDYTLELRGTVWVLCRQGEPWGKLYGTDLDELLDQSARIVWDEEDTAGDIARGE